MSSVRDNSIDKAVDEKFERALHLATEEAKQQTIGRLSEKMLHRTIKYYFEPDEKYHEVSFLGSVADVKHENRIYEIQTRSFDKLSRKLEKFLAECNVSVVYPLVTERTLVWISEENGETVSERKSSKRGRPSDFLSELARIPKLVEREGLDFIILPVAVHEYRLLNGYGKDKKKRAEHLEIIPDSFGDPISVSSVASVSRLLPSELASTFTAVEFCRAMRLRGIKASLTLRALVGLGIFEKIGKRGNAFIYKRSDF